MGVLIQGIIESIKTRKDRTLAITIGSQELGGEKAGELFGLNNSISNIYISAQAIDTDAMSMIDENVKETLDTIKSPSQRLRSVLFLNWQKNDRGFKSFDMYYINRMDEIINHFKKGLDE